MQDEIKDLLLIATELLTIFLIIKKKRNLELWSCGWSENCKKMESASRVQILAEMVDIFAKGMDVFVVSSPSFGGKSRATCREKEKLNSKQGVESFKMRLEKYKFPSPYP